MLDTIYNIGVAIVLIIIVSRLNSIQDLIRNDLDDAQWAIQRKNDALVKAAAWFKDYAVQHRAKGSEESNAKAAVNESRAETLRRAAEEVA